MNATEQQEFLAALEERWDDYPRQLKAARQEITEASIHDLRVAARRLQARLRILRALDSRPRLRRLWRLLKRQLDQLDGLHDTQVMLLEATQRVASLPQLDRFRKFLEEQSSNLALTARWVALASKPSNLKKPMKRIRKIVKKHSGDEDLTAQVLRAVDAAHAKTQRAFAQLDPEDPSTIHHVRVAFKQFRYMIEAARPLLRDYPETDLARMHNYQDAMGKVHDTTVFLDALQGFQKRLTDRGHAGAEPFDPRPIELYYRNRLDELVRAYFERKDEITSYWRPAPDQPFPWEKSHDSVHRAARHRRTTGQRQRRAAGQPAASDRRRTEEVPQGRPGAEGDRGPDRPDPDQPLPAGG